MKLASPSVRRIDSDMTSQNDSSPLLVEAEKILSESSRVIIDKEEVLRLCFACVLSQGHLLIEDQPGVGKTTLIKTFSALLGLETKRIQFTNDLLPADILGGAVYQPREQRFEIIRGPLFASLVFADELNRATPKSQSAFLQAMEEKKVSLEGEEHLLPQPFVVMATQNPTESIGTFPLPESQLDRFSMRIQIGPPSRDAEKELLLGEKRAEMIEALTPVWNAEKLMSAQEMTEKVHLGPSIADYVQDLAQFIRSHDGVQLSTRGTLDLVRCGKARAFLARRDFVLPEDIQAVFPAVIGHRLGGYAQSAEELVQEALDKVVVRE